MTLYPGLHGEPILEPKTEESESEPRRADSLGHEKNNRENIWRRELSQQKSQERMSRLSDAQKQRNISERTASRRAVFDQKNAGSSAQKLNPSGGAFNLSATEKNQQKVMPDFGAPKNLPKTNPAVSVTTSESSAASLAQKLVQKRLRWIMLTFIGGFLLANLPIIIFIFLIIAAGAAIGE